MRNVTAKSDFQDLNFELYFVSNFFRLTESERSAEVGYYRNEITTSFSVQGSQNLPSGNIYLLIEKKLVTKGSKGASLLKSFAEPPKSGIVTLTGTGCRFVDSKV